MFRILADGGVKWTHGSKQSGRVYYAMLSLSSDIVGQAVDTAGRVIQFSADAGDETISDYVKYFPCKPTGRSITFDQ